MRLISHRGNTSGPNPSRENEPSYIIEAIRFGYEVEIDVWFDQGKFKLGHDEPQYNIPLSLFEDYHSKLWIHAKNAEAIHQLVRIDPTSTYLHYFWHEEDDFTLTSRGYIWTFPGKLLSYSSICVMPELGYEGDLNEVGGICSDNIVEYRNFI